MLRYVEDASINSLPVTDVNSIIKGFKSVDQCRCVDAKANADSDAVSDVKCSNEDNRRTKDNQWKRMHLDPILFRGGFSEDL